MARDDPQMKIRLSDELKERIEEASKENGRSMNAEIAARLEDSFELEEQKGSRPVYEAVHTALQEEIAQYLLAFYDVLPVDIQTMPDNVQVKNLATALISGEPETIQAALSARTGTEVTLADELLGAELYRRRRYLEDLRRRLAPRRARATDAC